jgi:hypothetical protein
LDQYRGRSFTFPEGTLFTEISRNEALFFEKVLNLEAHNSPNNNLEELENDILLGNEYDDSSIAYYGDDDDDFIMIDLLGSRDGKIIYTLYVGPRWIKRIEKMISK